MRPPQTVVFSGRRAALLAALLAALIAGGSPAAAEDCASVLQEARIEYATGHFERAVDLLVPCRAGHQPAAVRAEVLAWLARTYLALDALRDADREIAALLELRPGFEPDAADSLELRTRVQQVKAGDAGVRILSVSKMSESLREAPATVLVITGEEIRRRGYPDLEALLHDLPGFDISRTNGFNYSHIYQRGYRSINTNRMLLLIDGVEENDLWSNNVWLSRQYPLSNIEAVEVIYGPASTMYGANAFLGVVNVLTREPDAQVPEGRRLTVEGELAAGSWNTRAGEFSLAGRLAGTGLAFSLTGRVFRSDEADLSDLPDWDYRLDDPAVYRRTLAVSGADAAARFLAAHCPPPCDPAAHPLFTVQVDAAGRPVAILPTDRAAALARTLDGWAFGERVQGAPVGFSDRTDDWYVYAKIRSPNLTVGLQSWRTEEGPGSWFSDRRYAGAANGTVWVPRQMFLYARYQRALLDNRLIVDGLTSYRAHELDRDTALTELIGYRDGQLGLDDLVAAEPVAARWQTTYFHQISKQFRSELRFAYRPNRRFDLVGGVEYRQGAIQGDYNLSFEPNPQETGRPGSPPGSGLPPTIAGNNVFDVRDTGLFAQASYRVAKDWRATAGLRFDRDRVDSTGGFGSVLNARYALVWTPGDWTGKVIYSEAFKDASFQDKYSSIPGLRVANPTVEPERVRNLELSAGWQANDRLSVEVAAYQASYSDVLANVLVTVGGQRVNQNQAIGALRIRGLQADSRLRLGRHTLLLNYTFTDPQNVDEDRRIGDIASHRLNAGIDLDLGKRLEGSLRANWVGARDTGADTTAATNPLDEIPSSLVLNGVLGYQPARLPVAVQLLVNNLLDRAYDDPGIRGASGNPFSSHLPQPGRNVLVRLRWRL
jgi:outer membrane receptor for ferrienterochelin and colicins